VPVSHGPTPVPIEKPAHKKAAQDDTDRMRLAEDHTLVHYAIRMGLVMLDK